MRLGVNVPNFGPGANPDVLRRWALTVEGLGSDLLMMSDHIAVTPDGAHPETAWRVLATVAERWNQQESKDIDPRTELR